MILTNRDTLTPPADSPNMVTEPGSPPKLWMCSWIHLRAWTWSSIPKFPDRCSSPVLDTTYNFKMLCGYIYTNWYSKWPKVITMMYVWHGSKAIEELNNCMLSSNVLSLLPEKAQKAQTILYQNHNHILVSSQGRAIIHWSCTHDKSSPVDPGHDLVK